MLSWIRNICLAGVVYLALVMMPGCNNYKNDYYDSDEDAWIAEQVEAGQMDEETANYLRELWKKQRDED